MSSGLGSTKSFGRLAISKSSLKACSNSGVHWILSAGDFPPTSWSKVCRTKEYSGMQELICLKDPMNDLIYFIVLGFVVPTKAEMV